MAIKEYRAALRGLTAFAKTIDLQLPPPYSTGDGSPEERNAMKHFDQAVSKGRIPAGPPPVWLSGEGMKAATTNGNVCLDHP